MRFRAAVKFFLPLIFVFVLTACEEKDPAPATGANDHVNSWIYENMKYWYYWANEMPDNPDKALEPEPFFESLLSDQDRFSWIQENFTDLLNSLRGVSKEAGFEFVLYRESSSNNNVLAQIVYIKPNSPASTAGLKRGDIINKINGTQITTENYQDLISKLSENHSLTYKSIQYEARTFSEAATIDLVPVTYAENPNHLSKVLTYNDRKIGYYVYNLFSEGPESGNKSYSNEMDQIIGSFKSQGITDLILDLRFNSGGAESAAQNLASLLVKNATSSTVFVKHEYNQQVTTDVKADPRLGEGYFSVPFLAKSQNIGSQLRDSRVYVLTGSRTASASELIINGLKPFMDVYLVGGTTVGKNVGSISIYDDEDPENKWGIQPIVTKLLNSEGQSNYADGFTPQIADEDNALILYPLGDPRETLLNKTILQITGMSSVTRSADTRKAGELLLHSLDLKKRSGITNISLPVQ